MNNYKHKHVTMPRAKRQAIRVSFHDTRKVTSETLKATPDFGLTKSQRLTSGHELVNKSTKAMTGPTGHLLVPDGSESHLHTLPIDFENSPNEILVRNTIGLHDPATIWPSRSLERHHAFQHLLNRCVIVIGR